ncbi:MerR family transcriptional regulator [cyanobacterium endosymbiont of Rhopalodia gibberula]|uniref:MerR family transcriptional regulator n=1 Tax=cyanobacterium endosymbiont of Rhopalodia gibberula TaxID=1763363 RepID=UPI0018D540B3|nr:MerR family transcriptional regulator [cyanobacterium endosymbiont of Rhopalodia gibberula]
MNTMPYLKISKLTQQTGFSTENLRYYSDLSLLEPVKKGKNNYCHSILEMSQQVKFMKKPNSLASPSKKSSELSVYKIWESTL